MATKKNRISELLKDITGDANELKNILEAFAFENSIKIDLDNNEILEGFLNDLKKEKFDSENFEAIIKKIK